MSVQHNLEPAVIDWLVERYWRGWPVDAANLLHAFDLGAGEWVAIIRRLEYRGIVETVDFFDGDDVRIDGQLRILPAILDIAPSGGREEETDNSKPVPGTTEATGYAAAFADAFNLIGDKIDQAVMAVAHDKDKTVERRLEEIFRKDIKYALWQSGKLSNLLQVSAGAIRQAWPWKAAQRWKKHPDTSLATVMIEYESDAE